MARKQTINEMQIGTQTPTDLDLSDGLCPQYKHYILCTQYNLKVVMLGLRAYFMRSQV